MKRKKNLNDVQDTDFSRFTVEELADAFVFPSEGKPNAAQTGEENEFWKARREKFNSRSPIQKMYGELLQLKFQLEDYITGNQYKESLNFGYFLNEYVSRQDKKNKVFAVEVDLTPAVLSQYINNHRKPKEEFAWRLETHSNGMIPAIYWYRLIQKDKEHEFMSNHELKNEESKHVKQHLDLAF